MLKTEIQFLIETRASRLARSYPRRFTFYVARPARSIFPFTFLLFESFFLPWLAVVSTKVAYF